jgi:hypothetical protein
MTWRAITARPSVVVDICKYYPELQKRYPSVDLLMKVCFGLLFLAVRDVFWVLTSMSVWKVGPLSL